MNKDASISGLETHTGYWLRLVSNYVSHAFTRKVEAHGVSVAEWTILRQLLGTDEAHPSQLAGRMAMTRGAITKLIDRLLEKGYVVRQAGTSDRRFQSIRLTASGRKLVPVLASLADQNDAEFFGHLSPHESSALIATLKNIASRQNLQGVPVD